MLRWYAVVLAAGWLALVQSQGDAQANPAPERPPIGGGTADPASFSFVLINGAGGIPENGALLLEGPYDNMPVVLVRTLARDATFSGTASQVETSPFWVWRPDEPLPLGAECEVVTMGDGMFLQDNAATFTVTPAIELQQPALELSPSASLITVVSENACCRTLFMTGGELEDTSQCFGVAYDSSMQVDPGVLTTSGRALANQYVFRFMTGTGERAVYSTGTFANLVLPVYRDQADEYCFEVTAIELPTLRELAYDDVDACADHGELEDLGPTAIEPTAMDLSREVCHAPPEGYEDAWCEVNEDCEDELSTAHCSLYPHICRGEPLGYGADGGEPSDGGAQDGGMSEPSEPRGGSNGGCAIGGDSKGTRSAWLGALIAMTWVMRRRRPTEPRCASGR